PMVSPPFLCIRRVWSGIDPADTLATAMFPKKTLSSQKNPLFSTIYRNTNAVFHGFEPTSDGMLTDMEIGRKMIIGPEEMILSIRGGLRQYVLMKKDRVTILLAERVGSG